MWRMPTVLSACRAWGTVSILRRARRFGRPAAGAGLILTTTCMPSRHHHYDSSLLTRPETGRGDASLWTAAAAPDHRLWTTLRGPLDPSRLPTSPLPRRRLPFAGEQSITTNQRRTTDRTPAAHARVSSDQFSGPHRWAIPEYRSGPFRLVKTRCTVSCDFRQRGGPAAEAATPLPRRPCQQAS